MSNITLELANKIMNQINKEEAEETAAENHLIELAKARFECLKDVLQTILDRGNWRFYGPKYVKVPLHIIYVPTNDYGKPEIKVCLCTKLNGMKELDNYYSHYSSWEKFNEDELLNDANFEAKAAHSISSQIKGFRSKIKELEKSENVTIR